MNIGQDRVAAIRAALVDARLEALVCTLPENVLLLSGYWPVVGTSIAVATASGMISLLVPTDEHDLAAHSWATTVREYSPGSLTQLIGPVEAARSPLADVLDQAGVSSTTIGYESGSAYEASSYAAMFLFGEALAGLLRAAAPGATLTPAAQALSRLRSVLMPGEVEQVRTGCAVVAAAVTAAAKTIQPGRAESELAAEVSGRLSTLGLEADGVQRADGFAYCMSGSNSARAGGAYARSTARRFAEGDFVLVHCNSTINGYWTDVTRTYVVGEPDERQRSMYDAVLTARHAALAALRPGAMASEVDGAARAALTERGFGANFTHGVGHNVGFSVISAEYPPRLHPASPDVMEVGMTFNIEPAIYIEGYGGLRHCDVVTLGPVGAEVLTPFHGQIEDLIVDAKVR